MKLDRKSTVSSMCVFVVCLFLVSQVHSLPRPTSQNFDEFNQTLTSAPATDKLPTAIETLNSKKVSVSAENEKEKPVFGDAESEEIKRNPESAQNVTNHLKESSSRQLVVPFIAVPSNWVATFQPSNAMVITQKVPLRIWAIGSVSRFPAFVERFVQRIQSYYSTYKYPDLSRPVAQSIISQQYHQHDAETDLVESNSAVENDATESETDASTTDDCDGTTDFNYDEEQQYASDETSDSESSAAYESSELSELNGLSESSEMFGIGDSLEE